MSDTARIPTNLRTLLILEVLGRSDRPMSPTEINTEIGLPKQTIHRLVSTLEREGFLIREGKSNRFRPSRRLRMMGAGLLYASRANIARHQILVEVSKETGEAVNFVVPEETGMNYLDRVETNWPFRIQLPRGSNVPFHATASGKTFMASLRPKARARFVAALTLDPLTENTHTTAESLLQELAQVARAGFALDRQEFMLGMVAIAVPVCDADGRFIAALATHGPIQRMTLELAESHQSILKDAAENLRDVLFD